MSSSGRGFASSRWADRGLRGGLGGDLPFGATEERRHTAQTQGADRLAEADRAREFVGNREHLLDRQAFEPLHQDRREPAGGRRLLRRRHEEVYDALLVDLDEEVDGGLALLDPLQQVRMLGVAPRKFG